MYCTKRSEYYQCRGQCEYYQCDRDKRNLVNFFYIESFELNMTQTYDSN